MSTPANAATQGEQPGSAENKQATIGQDKVIPELSENDKFESAVNDAVKNITRGNDGKYIIPEGTSIEVKHAAISEQRRRDTQSEYTKMSQTKKALEAENNALKKRAVSEVTIELTTEQTEEMDNLKFSDPEAWRKKMNRYENEARDKQTKAMNDEIAQVSADTLAKDELEHRKDILSEFNQEHPDFQLNDDLIKNDIPPRITKKLETGKITFVEFLKEVYDYTKTGKVIKQDTTTKQPNLSKIGGSHMPDENAVKVDTITSYNKEVF